MCGGLDYEHDVKIISVTGEGGRAIWVAYLSFQNRSRHG